jgi:hypothetical protein
MRLRLPSRRDGYIYRLINVMVNVVPHLVGTISKVGMIYDVTAQKVVYNFSAFGTAPIADISNCRMVGIEWASVGI